MSRNVKQDELYQQVICDYGSALDRLTGGYEADAGKREDLRQNIHLNLWRSLAHYDGRCSLRTWAYRVAHNVAASYVNRERQAAFLDLDQLEVHTSDADPDQAIDHQRALGQLTAMVRALKPLERQITLLYLEELDATAIAEITGISPANVAMKIHRIKKVLAAKFAKEHSHVR